MEFLTIDTHGDHHKKLSSGDTGKETLQSKNLSTCSNARVNEMGVEKGSLGQSCNSDSV